MKKALLAVVAFFTINILIAQPPEITRDASGNKIIKGFISKSDLLTDTAFIWYAQNLKGYTPEANAVNTLRSNKESINIIGFAGTWCDDTKNILPKFYAFADASGFSNDRITMLGVDRNKKTIQHLTEAFNVTNVPTFIIMKDGREIGRVVEYGKYGMVDKEIGEIITNASKKN